MKSTTNPQPHNPTNQPTHTAQAMEHAVCSTRPRVQYRVGIDAKYGLVWSQIFPLRIGEKVVYQITTNAKMRSIVGLRKEEAAGAAAQAAVEAQA